MQKFSVLLVKKMVFYNSVAGLLRGIFRLMFNVKIEGVENIPKSGGTIFVSNHKSNFDPPFLACFLPVQLTFMAKKELFDFKPIGALLRKCGAFPIKRGGSDISAMKAALKLLTEKHNMLIFPEGTRSPENGKILRGKSGAALLAYKSNSRIIPIGIIGEYKFRKKMLIKIGKPLDISTYLTSKPSSADLQKFTDDEIMENIRLLAGAEYYED